LQARDKKSGHKKDPFESGIPEVFRPGTTPEPALNQTGKTEAPEKRVTEYPVQKGLSNG
jgi:hypothetical protein